MKIISSFTKAVAAIIILHLFFLFPACGKKGDPIPPQPEKPGANADSGKPRTSDAGAKPN